MAAYVPGSVTAASVVAWAEDMTSVPTGADLAMLNGAIAAVDEYVVRTKQTADGYADGVTQAIIQQSYRTWKRRRSPDGVAALDDFRPITFGGLDKDLRWLVSPKWGFA